MTYPEMNIAVFTVASLLGGLAPDEGLPTSARAQKLVRPDPTHPGRLQSD
ncbi:hypothetical protein ACFWDQ_41820 [Streptomyces sp. NPDC060053]